MLLREGDSLKERIRILEYLRTYLEDIASPTYGVDQLVLGRAVHFRTEPVDMDFYDVRILTKMLTPVPNPFRYN